MVNGVVSCVVNTRHTPARLPEQNPPGPTPRPLLPPLFVFPSLFRLQIRLSPTIPEHPGNSPVSPIIPVHTQKQGVGGIPRKMRAPITPMFSSAMLTIQLSAIVGAPTFSFRPASLLRQASRRTGPTKARKEKEPVPRGGVGHYRPGEKRPPQKAATTKERRKSRDYS